MINLALALAAALLTGVAVVAFQFSWYAALIPAVLVLAGTYVLLARRTFAQVQKLMTQVQEELSAMPPSQKEQRLKVDRAVKLLESALPLSRWQFLVAGEVYAQIGMLKFLVKDLDGAIEAFTQGSSRNGLAKAMQASAYFQKKDTAAMEKAFEAAVTATASDGMLWAAYAWCLKQLKEDDRAQAILARGVAANPKDEKLKAALSALQNDKKLKMKPWEPNWWQLGLETPSMAVQQPQFMAPGRRPRLARR